MRSLITALALLMPLVGCTDAVRRAEAPPVPEEAPEEIELPFEEPAPRVEALSAELLYSLLTAEVATQRDDLGRAMDEYLTVARTSGLAYAAERAARIARFKGSEEVLGEAVELWVERAPNDAVARRFAASQSLSDGAPEEAMRQLEALIRIARAKGENGFLEAAEVLAGAADKVAGLEMMRRLVEEYDSDPEARYALVLVALGAERFEEAEENARRVLERRPDWHHVRVLLGRILVERDDAEAALDMFARAVRAHPDSAVLRTAYAQLLVEQNDVERAYEQFSALLEQGAESADVRFALGVLAVELDRPGPAREHLSALYRMGERRDEAAFFLGRLEQKQGNRDEAIAWYRKVDGKEYRSEARVLLADLLAEGGDLKAAREVLGRLRERNPGQATWLYLEEADLLEQHGTPDQVWRLYEQALEAQPAEPDLLYARAMFAATRDKIEVLERDLRAILEEDPTHADALNALGYTLADQTDRYEEALGYIERALALKPDSPAILDSMGWVLYRLDRPEEALPYLRRALDAGFDGEIAAHLGEVLWALGRTEEARAVWGDALERDPDNPYVRETVDRLD